MNARDENLSTDANALPILAVVEKYEAFVHYLYPILQRSPRQHSVLRDTVLAALFVPVGGLYRAAKSRQVSWLHAVDAEFATLRSHLRFLVLPTIKIITQHQQITALALLAEPGKMLGAWIRKLSNPAAQIQKPARPVGQAGKC